MNNRTSWRTDILAVIAENGETVHDIVACVPELASKEMNTPFDHGYGGYEGCPFTCWTTSRVYFPRGYDGAECVASVPRHPCPEVTNHIGGG